MSPAHGKFDADTAPAFKQYLGTLYEKDFRRLFASLVRSLRDFDVAEDLLHEAFIAANNQWPVEGIPKNPQAWLIQVAKHKGLDRLRREKRFDPLDEAHLESEAAQYEPDYASEAGDDIEDDRLRLIFTCCHPALDRQVQVALTLREVCGLSTEAIASAFLAQTPAMAQRLVRGKAKIKAAGIPYVVPEGPELPERLEAVLAVVYLVYNEGYRASSGERLGDVELAEEAIRLCRLLVQLLPETEVLGLLALMLLNESRRPARTTEAGDLVLLEDQDRTLWRRDYVEEGLRHLEQAFTQGAVGSYSLQAAISAQHAVAPSVAETNWPQIVVFYDALLELTRSPVVALNRAVAVAMRDGPEAGLALIDALLEEPALAAYHPVYSAHAELSRRAGRLNAARESYQKALQLVQQAPERRFLEQRLATL
ncbi:MAG: RNA polymerase sigma factor [Pseudomonadota bacterium]|nr:RNA polymerase sigma factor [Pseudomonadota bacterium]